MLLQNKNIELVRQMLHRHRFNIVIIKDGCWHRLPEIYNIHSNLCNLGVNKNFLCAKPEKKDLWSLQ